MRRLPRIGYVVADLRRVGPTNQTFNIIRFSGAINNCLVISLFAESDDTSLEEFVASGIDVVCLKLDRKTALLSGAKRLRACLVKNGVQIVHSWGVFADVLSYQATKRTSFVHAITLRNFPQEDLTLRKNVVSGRLTALLHLHVLKKCEHVVACSHSVQHRMEDVYGWDNLIGIQNGVDLNRYRPTDRRTTRANYGLVDADTVFVTVGSLTARKRTEETIESFLQVEALSHTHLWIVGDGELSEELRQQYGNNPHVKFWGNRTDVPHLLSAADVFVSSSESEGMPNSVLEAIACGVPVILSDIPQHAEVLGEAPGSGLMYPLGDKEQLCQLMTSLSTEALARMRLSTGQIHSSNLTMSRMGERYGSFYETLDIRTA